MPFIYNALIVQGRDMVGQQMNVTCEVQQLLGNNRIRAVAICIFFRQLHFEMDFFDDTNKKRIKNRKFQNEKDSKMGFNSKIKKKRI